MGVVVFFRGSITGRDKYLFLWENRNKTSRDFAWNRVWAFLIVVVWGQDYNPNARARAWRARLSPCTSRISPGGAGMDFTQLTSMF
jgi:hypothetical protein